jgi:hypothetical protein
LIKEVMRIPAEIHGRRRTGDGLNGRIKFQKNLEFISLLLKGDQKTAAERLRDTVIEPYELAQFLDRHRLQLFLLSLLGGSPLQKWLPQEWLDKVRSVSARRWARQERLLRELQGMSTVLTNAGREFILLKGPYFAIRFFGSTAHREFRDLDILIRRPDLHTVEKLLRTCGYVRKSRILVNPTLTTYFTHALDFTKPNVKLDLHWSLSASAGHRLDYDAIWRSRQPFLLGSQEFFVLSEEHEVMFKLMSIFKDLERGAVRLQAFIDLYFILSAFSDRIDWSQFVANRRRERILQLSVNVLALFLDLFSCSETFPAVATAVAKERQRFKGHSSTDLVALFEAPRGALRNKLYAAGIYDCSRMHVFFWWLVSLPFRLVVHQPDKFRRLRGVIK